MYNDQIKKESRLEPFKGRNYGGFIKPDGSTIIKEPMSKTKDNLEEEKSKRNNQLDADYWEEKGGKKMLEELQKNVHWAGVEVKEAEYGMKEAAREYVDRVNNMIKESEKLENFLEATQIIK